MSILMKIGNNQEDESIIDELFDLEKWTTKPGYPPASEFNLFLSDC